MNVELVNKQEAFIRAESVSEVALAIARENKVLPGFSDAPECKLYCSLLSMGTMLRIGEACVFINGKPAYLLTDFNTEHGTIIGMLFCKNVVKALIEEEKLVLTYVDGVVEKYIYQAEFEAWKLGERNLAIVAPPPSAN